MTWISGSPIQTPTLSLSGYTASDGMLCVERKISRTVPSPALLVLCAPAGPAGKHTRSPGPTSSSPSGWRTRTPPPRAGEPLLVGLPVVGAQRLPGRELEDLAGHGA